MLGEEVSVWRKTATGKDSFGEDIYTWTSENVTNCIIRPLTGADVAETYRTSGRRASYSIAFPKTYEKRAHLAGCKVTFRELDEAQALFVIGEPDVTSPCPTAWDVVAEVGRVDG